MENFKIQGVGIDTSNLTYSIPNGHNKYNYVHTSLRANNDFILSSYVGEELKDVPLITTATFLDKLDLALLGHTLTLGRNAIDLLLIDSKCDIKKYIETLKGLLDSRLVYQIGIYSSGDLETLKKAVEDIKSIMLVRYVSLEICPLNFDYDIINWAKESGISLIGFNPFGGRLSAGVLINSFTSSYLLGFAANYCDIVMLSSRDMYKSDEQLDYLTQLIGEESNPKYNLKKSAHKLVKPIKKLVNTSIKLSEDTTVPYNSPDAIFSPEELVLNLGKTEEKIAVPDMEDKLVKGVNDYIQLVDKPEDGDWKDYCSILRSKVRLLLKSMLGPDCNILATTVTDTVSVFVVNHVTKNKKWYNFKKDVTETRNFVFCCTETNTVFLELKNSSQDISNS